MPPLGGFASAAALVCAFVAWERRRPDPMLDVRIFARSRFSAACAAVAVAFFALFGFIFLVTQYFQVVRGYGTLSAGVHALPFAVGAGVAAPAAEVADQAPAAARETILDGARSAFLDGMAAGCRVAALATIVGAVAALAFLSDRADLGPDLEPDREGAEIPPTAALTAGEGGR